jgi:hypothetical protein
MCGKKSWTVYGKSTPEAESGRRLKPNRASFARDSQCNYTLTPLCLFTEPDNPYVTLRLHGY